MDKGAYYNGIAPGYNRLHGAEQQRKIKSILSEIEVTQNSWLLDVGCGTGVSFPMFDCMYKFGLDPAIELLKRSNSEFKGQFVNGQGECLPFRSGIFDIVICMTALHNFDNPEEGIAEMRRVAKNSGTIVITVLKRPVKSTSVVQSIRKLLKIRKELDDMHDYMFICENEVPEVPEESEKLE